MPALSDFSINNLTTCDQRIQLVTIEVAKLYDIRVLEGKRTWSRQRQLFMEERTTLMPPASNHTPDTEGDVDWLSMAVDIAPYPIDWHDAKRFTYLAGLMIGIARANDIILRWGGNWDMDQIILDDQNFDDLPHFEIVE